MIAIAAGILLSLLVLGLLRAIPNLFFWGSRSGFSARSSCRC